MGSVLDQSATLLAIWVLELSLRLEEKEGCTCLKMPSSHISFLGCRLLRALNLSLCFGEFLRGYSRYLFPPKDMG